MAQASPPTPSQRFAHIDGLRAMAVLLVVVAHAGLGNIVPGGSGVTIFFSVSGFIITFLILRERDRTSLFDVGGFYARRALKIFPPLTVVVIAPTIIWSQFAEVDWGDFLAQILFVFNWSYIDGEVEVLPGSAVVWSLAVEEQFYIAFAAFWMVIVSNIRWRKLLVLAAAMAATASTLVRVLLASDPDMVRRIYYGTDTRLDAIAFGVLAAALYHGWVTSTQPSSRLRRWMSNDLTVLLALTLYIASLLIRDEWFRDTFRYSFQGIAACLVILWGMLPGAGRFRRVFFTICGTRPVALIGLASYSIYLVHLSLYDVLRPLVSTWSSIWSVPFLTVAGVVAGIAVYFAVEVPVLRWRRARDEVRGAERVREIEDAGRDTGV